MYMYSKILFFSIHNFIILNALLLHSLYKIQFIIYNKHSNNKIYVYIYHMCLMLKMDSS